jgi:hypothetical protein
MTSKREIRPLFFLEAMSASKPWVSTTEVCVSEREGGIFCLKPLRQVFLNSTREKYHKLLRQKGLNQIKR